MVSFLKALYGNAATKENDFAFNYLPKVDRKYSWVKSGTTCTRARSRASLPSA